MREWGIRMGKAEIVMIHEDVRGRIFRVTIDKHEFYVLETRRGYARGGHSHTEDSFIAVLEGSLEYKARIDDREEVRIISEGDVVFTEKNVPTILTALEDSLMIQWLEGPLVTINYEPYRRIVRELMQKK